MDLEVLRQYEREGWLTSQKHDTLDLIVFNYSRATEYERKWDEITTNCRATVFNSKGELIAKGFKKFFNWEEGKTLLPYKIYTVKVYEKLDGSFIQLFYYSNQWVVMSKGSFTSDQALWAQEIIDNRDISQLNKDWTYCFELIKPENIIVCDYGDKEDLIFLRAFSNGKELDIDVIPEFNSVDSSYNHRFSYEDLKYNEEETNKEGFVIQFDNGERCKIKFEEYKRIHNIVTNTTSYDIWEVLRVGGDFSEVLDRVPDEFMDFVINTREDLENKFNEKLREIEIEFYNIVDKKEFAEKAKQSANTHFLFTRLNTYSDNLKDSVWLSIKPEFKKAFENECKDK